VGPQRPELWLAATTAVLWTLWNFLLIREPLSVVSASGGQTVVVGVGTDGLWATTRSGLDTQLDARLMGPGTPFTQLGRP